MFGAAARRARRGSQAASSSTAAVGTRRHGDAETPVSICTAGLSHAHDDDAESRSRRLVARYMEGDNGAAAVTRGKRSTRTTQRPGSRPPVRGSYLGVGIRTVGSAGQTKCSKESWMWWVSPLHTHTGVVVGFNVLRRGRPSRRQAHLSDGHLLFRRLFLSPPIFTSLSRSNGTQG